MKKERPETKLCKHCKTEIPYGAKICPNCRKRVKGGKAKWVVLAFVAILVISALGSGGDDGVQKVGTVGDDTSGESGSVQEASDSGESAAAQTEFHVGDILQDGDMKIVYMASGIYEEDNEYLEPDEGNQYIFLRFAFENTSETDDESVSFYSFNGYADGYAAEMYYGDDNDLSATLSTGRTEVGNVIFEASKDAKEITVEYEPNFLSDEKITFVYDGEKDSGYEPEKNTTATEGAFAVGDEIAMDEVVIRYLSCEPYEEDNDFLQPKEGYHYITCTFEFENNGSSDIYPTMYDFDCFADGISCDGYYGRDDELSATVSAGHKASGTVSFEVPDDVETVEVEYLANIWTSERIVFSVS